MEEKIFECPPGDHLQPCFVHLNWDAAVDHSAAANFESTLSSIVSSPSAATPPPHENLVLRELIGRLGSICNSGELSPRTSRYGGAATSCYSTPLNSPPKLNLSGLGNPMAPPPHLFNGDPEFAERAARLSCFGGGGGSFSPQIGISRVSSSQSLMAAPPEDAELGSSREEKIAGRKRKTPAKGKTKEDQNSKRSKSEESAGTGEDDGKPPANSDSGDDKGSNSKPPEPPKQDFIHVRARRGQATDSHSLAERVRREKISQRMKFLQDLVPGCNKVTGKALMLDEIINYVQSLQRQVEFLSMKLATVNPRLDFNVESLLPKGMNHPIFPSAENLSAAFPFSTPEAHLQSIIAGGGAFENHHHHHHHSLAGFMDGSSQLPAFWDDELHSVVQMGSSQNQEPALSSQSLHGDGNGIHPASLSATHMTIQL